MTTSQFSMEVIEDSSDNTPKSYSELFYSRKELVCLLPNTSRKLIKVGLPKKIENMDILYKTFSESIESQYNTSKIYMMSIRGTFDKMYQLELGISDVPDNSKQYYYDIVFIIVPKELIYKLENEGVHCIKYYVGKSQNSADFKILDSIPPLNMISTTDNMMHLPFSWRVNLS